MGFHLFSMKDSLQLSGQVTQEELPAMSDEQEAIYDQVM